MRILITGSSGFVGVALSEHLLAAGIDVVGYDLNPVSAQVLMTFSALPGRFYQETGDVGDSGTLRNVMSQPAAGCYVSCNYGRCDPGTTDSADNL